MIPFYILTGPPGAGKTSLIEALAHELNVVAEPARRVLAEQREIGGQGTGDQDASLFVKLMTERAVHDYERASGLTLFDRGLPDLLAFCAYYDLPDTLVKQTAAHYRYQRTVFWLPAWDAIYEQDDERRLDFEGAKAFGALIKAAYGRAGYELLTVPCTSIAERVTFIRQQLAI
jgi:predicted ATPase